MSEKSLLAQMEEELDKVLLKLQESTKEAGVARKALQTRVGQVDVYQEQAQNLRMALYALEGKASKKTFGDANQDNHARLLELKRGPDL